MKIIAFGHRRNVGKDLACKIIADHLNKKYIVQHNNFAHVLKKEAFRLFRDVGLMHPYYYDAHREDKEKNLPKIGMSPREVWIKYGNDMRAVWPDVWVNLMFNEIDPMTEILLISDLRYPNEAEFIKDRGGYLIKIERDVVKFDDVADTALANFEGWDFTIYNNDNICDYTNHLTALVDKILE
jgi:hypothetical protein